MARFLTVQKVIHNDQPYHLYRNVQWNRILEFQPYFTKINMHRILKICVETTKEWSYLETISSTKLPTE